MMNIELLKEELVNGEYTFNGLDNFMVSNGFYSEYDILSNDDAVEEIIKSGVITYQISETESNVYEYVSVIFELIELNVEDEVIDTCTIKVLNIEAR